jgi:hypothetical protein
VQQVALHYGIYISQGDVRSWLGEEPLKINVNEHVILEKLQLNYVQWDRKKKKRPQFANFGHWSTPYVMENHPILVEVNKLDMAQSINIAKENRRLRASITSRGSSRQSSRSGSAPSSQDPVPVRAAAKKTCWMITGSNFQSGSEYLTINTCMSVRSSVKTIISLGLPSKITDKSGRTYEVYVDRSCVNACAVTGVKQIVTHDGVPRLLPVTIDITEDTQREPDPYSGEQIVYYKANVVAKGLVPGAKYVMFRYKSLSDVPTALSEVSDSRHISSLYFRPNDVTWAVREVIASNCTAYFRCMLAKNGETEHFSPVRPFSPSASQNNIGSNAVSGAMFPNPDGSTIWSATEDLDHFQQSNVVSIRELQPKTKLRNIEEKNELPVFMRKRKKSSSAARRSKNDRDPPNYNITVHIEGSEVQINCGEGKQTLKWLALAAAGRVARSAKSKGRIRIREKVGACSEIKSILPSMLSSSKWDSEADLQMLNMRPNTATRKHGEDQSAEYNEVGATYFVPGRTDIWTPEKLAPQVAFLTKVKQVSALKVADKKQKAAKLMMSAIKVKKKSGGSSGSVPFPLENGKPTQKVSGGKTKSMEDGDTREWDHSRPGSRARTRSRGSSRSGRSRPGSKSANKRSRPGSRSQNRSRVSRVSNTSGDIPLSPYVLANGAHAKKSSGALHVSEGHDVKAFLNQAFATTPTDGGARRLGALPPFGSVGPSGSVPGGHETNRSISTTWSSEGVGGGKHKVNPTSKIKDVLRHNSHIWAELFEGNEGQVSTWMDDAFYHGKNTIRNEKIMKKAQAIKVKEQAFWAVIAARKRVDKAKYYTSTTESLINDGVVEIVDKISQIAVHFGKMLKRFMKKFLKLTQTETADVQIAEAAMVTLGLLPDAIAHMKENKNMANAMKTLRLVEHSVVQSAKLVNMKKNFNDPPTHTLDELLQDLKPLIKSVTNCDEAIFQPESEEQAWNAAKEADETAERAATLMTKVRRRASTFQVWIADCEKKFYELNDGIEDFVESEWEKEKERMGALTSFDHDWERTKIDSIVPHREEYYKIRDICRDYYHILKGVFQHFCIIGNSASADGDYTISLSEFMIFAKKIKIIDGTLLHVTDVQRIFVLTNAGRQIENKGDEEFECHEFMEALIRVAILRYSTEHGGNVVKAVDYLFHKKVAHLYFHAIYDPHFREHLENYRVKNVYKRYDHILEDVFYLVGIPLGEYEDTLDMTGFSKLIFQAKLVDALLTRIEVKKAFVQSQMKPISPDAWIDDDEVEDVDTDDEKDGELGPNKGQVRAEAEDLSLRQMDYDEFKEALGRCAVYKWDDQSKYNDKTLDWKLEQILINVVKLDPLDLQARRRKNAKLGLSDDV